MQDENSPQNGRKLTKILHRNDPHHFYLVVVLPDPFWERGCGGIPRSRPNVWFYV